MTKPKWSKPVYPDFQMYNYNCSSSLYQNIIEWLTSSHGFNHRVFASLNVLVLIFQNAKFYVVL